MFETAELGRSVSKDEYDAREEQLRVELLEAQADLKAAASFPVIILVAGVEGAGKGETVNTLHEWLDPRFLETHAFGPPSDEESERPEFWRFWRALPPAGRIGMFYGSWYTRPIVDRAFDRTSNAEFDVELERINHFEKELSADGALIIKFWLHLSRKAQRKRLTSLAEDDDTRWRVTKRDWKFARHYDGFRRTSEHALRGTSTGEAPWIVVEAADRRYRHLTVGQHILDRLTGHLAEQNARIAAAADSATKPNRAPKTDSAYTILDTLDVSKSLTDKAYKQSLEKWQGELNRLTRALRAEGRSLVLAFEGWDAAGKGGAIRRLTEPMDARDYNIIPIAAPTSEEKSHHYLWRFWRHLPRAGRVTIFDRSWYGRVLVERVEGFATDAEWSRAYAEIVRFEQQQAEHGTVVHKFWVHISKDEQLRRFKEREKTPFKHFKITAEDFRNRKKWDAYEVAANEMVERTSTDFAPWTLVEGNDKQWARVRVLKTVCDRLRKELK